MGFSHDAFCIRHKAVYVSKRYVIGRRLYITSLFRYLVPAVRPSRMRERMVLQTYEGGDKVNFTSDACFLLVLLLPGRVRCNQHCVCGWERPSISYYWLLYAKKGFFLSIEWSDRFGNTSNCCCK